MGDVVAPEACRFDFFDDGCTHEMELVDFGIAAMDASVCDDISRFRLFAFEFFDATCSFLRDV